MLVKVILILSILLAGCVQRTAPSAPASSATTERPSSVAGLHFAECARLSLLIMLLENVRDDGDSEQVQANLADALRGAALRSGMSDRETEQILQQSFDKATADLFDVALELQAGREPDKDTMVLQGYASCMAVGVDLEPLVSAKP